MYQVIFFGGLRCSPDTHEESGRTNCKSLVSALRCAQEDVAREQVWGRNPDGTLAGWYTNVGHYAAVVRRADSQRPIKVFRNEASP